MNKLEKYHSYEEMLSTDGMYSIMCLLDDYMADQIVGLDIRNVSSISDFFIIAEADNVRKVKAITNHIEDSIEKVFQVKPRYREGMQESKWIILDYVDFIIHIFLNEERKFYDLERIWKDANPIPFP